MADYSVDIQARLSGFEKLDRMEAKILSLQNNNKIKIQFDTSGLDKLNGLSNATKQMQNAGKQAGRAYQNGLHGAIKSSKFTPNIIDYGKLKLKTKKEIESISEQMYEGLNSKLASRKDTNKWANQYISDRTKEQNKILQTEKKYQDNLNKIRDKEFASYNNPYRDAYQSAGKKDKTLEDMKKYYQEQEKISLNHYQKQEKQLALIQKRTQSGEFELRNTKNQAFLDKYSGQDSDAIRRAKKQIDEIKLLQSELQSGKYQSGSLKGLEIIPDDQIAKVDQLDNAIQKLRNSMQQVGIESSKTLADGIAETSVKKVESYARANSKALKQYGSELNNIQNLYANMTTQAEKIDIDNKFRNLQSKISASGLTGKSSLDELVRGFRQIAQFAGTYGIIQNILFDGARKMVQAVKDVNASQIELTKVSNAPTAQLTAYWDEAAVSAKKYGSTISDVISNTADWSRLGYNLDDAKKLSDATTLLQKVGDNMTQESSSKGLISTLKGFQMEANEVNSIVDKVNEVANTQPIDTSGIFAGLERSASSMDAANNSLEQTIALITAANSVVQDPDAVGTSFKTISMRIRGAATELEEAGLETDGMAESTAKLREELLALSGVDIMKDKNTFKGTYEILDELALKWKGLTDIEQASITELIAGKRQGNVVSALMSNFDIARKTLQTATNDSDGSAERELENWNKGIEASIAHFQAQLQSLATASLNSNIFKGLIDGGTALLDVLTQIIDIGGGIPALFGAIGGIAILKNLDRTKPCPYTYSLLLSGSIIMEKIA